MFEGVDGDGAMSPEHDEFAPEHYAAEEGFLSFWVTWRAVDNKNIDTESSLGVGEDFFEKMVCEDSVGVKNTGFEKI